MKGTIQNARRQRQDQDRFYREYLERKKQKEQRKNESGTAKKMDTGGTGTTSE
jgi:hypothetical protein